MPGWILFFEVDGLVGTDFKTVEEGFYFLNFARAREDSQAVFSRCLAQLPMEGAIVRIEKGV